MKRVLLFALCFGLASCAKISGTQRQDEGLWKYLYSIKNERTGADSSFFAKDSDRFTDEASSRYPKLALKITSSDPTPYQEAIAEFDCDRRAYRSRIFLYLDGREEKATNLNWTEIIPNAPAEALLKYACRDRKAEK